MKNYQLIAHVAWRLLMIVALSFVLASCVVDGRIALRADDIGAALGGKTGIQLRNAIQAKKQAYSQTLKRRDYDGALRDLMALRQVLENAFAYVQDDMGASRSPLMFTARKVESQELNDISDVLLAQYVQTTYDLIRLCLITGRFEEYVGWLHSTSQRNVYLKKGSATVIDTSPESFGEMVRFAFGVSEKLAAECRYMDVIRILAPLQRELEIIADALPGGWAYRIGPDSQNLRTYFSNCGRELARCYLAAGDLPHADDTIKVALGELKVDEGKIETLLIASETKRRLAQERYAKMYFNQASSILTKNPVEANRLQFFKFATPELLEFMLPAQPSLPSGIINLMWPTLSMAKQETLLSFDRGLLPNAAYYSRRSMLSESHGKYSEKYAEAYWSLFRESTPTPGAIHQMATFSSMLVRDKKWLEAIHFFGPQMHRLEAVCLLEQGAAVDIAQILKALSISVYMSGPAGLQQLLRVWPFVSGFNFITPTEAAFSLSEASKWLALGQTRTAEEEIESMKVPQKELGVTFRDWLAENITSTEFLSRRQEIFNHWDIERTKKSGVPYYIDGFCKRCLETTKRSPRAEDIDLEFQVVGDIVLCFRITEKGISGAVSPWPYDKLNKEIRGLREAAQSGNEPAIKEIAPQLFVALCTSLSETNLPTVRLRVAADGAIGMIPFDLLIYRAMHLSTPSLIVKYVPFFSQMPKKASFGQRGPKKALLMGDPLPLDVKKSASYTGNPANDIAMGFRGISVKGESGPASQKPGQIPGAPSPFESDIIIGQIPYTSEEVNSLKESAQRNGYKVKVLLGLDFNKKAVRDALGEAWDFAHFATHAFFTDEIPYIREPAIYLTPGIRPIDAFLLANEVRKCNLSKIGTVVLSACNTGFDIAPNGEGIAGIASAFLLAGARRVVLTLWAIDDQAATDFMRRFYAFMLQGTDPDLALEQAKKQMASESKHSSSQFWAPFVIYSMQ